MPDAGCLTANSSSFASLMAPGWVVPGDLMHWRWDKVVGITCEHVYAHVTDFDGKRHGLARVALASLGPPLPPD